jgi:DNA-binding HxlR family transcriptional regulator
MGNLKDQMSRVLREWDEQDEKQTQEKVMENKRTTVSKIMEFIIATPEINSVDLRKRVLAKYPEIQESHVSSTLKQLADARYVTREEVRTPVGRNTFNYTVVPEGERRAHIAEEKAKYKAAVIRAEKARAAKAAKREAGATQVGISDLVPKRKVGDMGTAMKSWRPATIEWVADDVINSLSVTQARELYDRLKKIFGG